MSDFVELDPKRRATSDFVEWTPKRHGQKPPYWLPDMLTSVDGKNFARQPNWAWIAGSVYYVPREAVGMVREAVEPEPVVTDADRIKALTAEIERLRKALESVLARRYGDWCDIARAALEKQP